MAANIAPDRVLKALLKQPNGTSVGELLERFPDLSRRTAQRMLAAWVDEGIVVRQGQGPNTRYVPFTTHKDPVTCR
jgi:predicted HTH transcriptional regulator